jgi:hypothetical protein
MADDLRERLLASFGDMGEAMVAQNVLDSAGVPCRVADLAGLPSHMMGTLGGINRSVGIWVLEPDVERAVAMLAAPGASGSGVDEEALTAEALAAAPPDEPAQEPFASPSQRAAEARHAPGIGRVALVVVVSTVAVLLAQRGCA